MNDPWKHLRKDLFGNVEPGVVLTAVTVPMECLPDNDDEFQARRWFLDDCIEALPGRSARISYGSALDDIDAERDLTPKTIRLGHHTPLEAVQFNFHVTGISKSCGSQLSRHRIGQGHVSSSRRYQEQQPAFVYPMLNWIEIEGHVKAILCEMERGHQEAMVRYDYLRTFANLSKSDARRVIPVSSVQERNWWINARALRDFFRLRLAKDAEWEIRRMAGMVLDVVRGVTPVLFEDIGVRQNEG